MISLLLTCVYPDVVLVVGGAGEGSAAALLRADVGPLPSVGADVHLADVGRGERTVAPFEWAFKGALACARG